MLKNRALPSLLATIITIGAITFSFLHSAGMAARPGEGPQPMIGEAAPLFELRGVDGESYSLAGAAGKIVVIHFATTWCPFCNAEAPHLEKLYQEYRERGVMVYIVDVKEDLTVVEKLVDRFQFSFPVLLDGDGAVATKYAPEGVQPDLARDEVPLASNLVIDGEGKIRFYSLLNTMAFDAKLIKVRETVDRLLIEDSRP